jgi:hypothetical protein
MRFRLEITPTDLKDIIVDHVKNKHGVEISNNDVTIFIAPPSSVDDTPAQLLSIDVDHDTARPNY